jgi:hypothetical protein
VTRAGSLKTRTNTPMMALRRPAWPQLRRGSWRRLRHSLAVRLPPTTLTLLLLPQQQQPLREGPGARSPSCPSAPPVVPPFWSSTTQSAGAVDVTAAMLDPVQALIDGTVKQQWIGKGRDVAKKSGAVEVNEVVSFLMFWIFFDCGF